MERLPAAAREVYVLAEIEDLDHAEVAELLDISRPAVRTRLHRARLALREALDAYFHERRSRTDPSTTVRTESS